VTGRGLARSLLAGAAALVLNLPIAAQEPAPAGPLVAAYRAARDFDPQFRTAVAERTVNESAVTTARFAYTPELRYQQQQSEIENASRNTFTVVQPLINADRFFTWREREPREIVAQSTFQQREQELALRILRAVTEILRAREAIRANETRIRLMEEQSRRAERMFKLQEGTITDVRDTAVRMEQARATQLQLLTRLKVAQNQYASIVGKPPTDQALRIADQPRRVALEPLDTYLNAAQMTNPQLVTSRQSERIAELGSLRARAAVLPQLSAAYVNTSIEGRRNDYVGLQLALPLQAQNATQITSARAQAEQAHERTRDLEQRMRVEVERLWALVESGEQQWVIRRQAIQAAELAVEANLKSQQGGVRTQVDVLNSIQTLSDVRNDYADTAATLAENYLSLLIQSAQEPISALRRVEQVLFQDAAWRP
jgi:outer membrane protein, protease secretion system